MRSRSTNLICPNPKCKEEINKPILLTDFSKTPAESYYACPRCMTKLNDAGKPQEVLEKGPTIAKEIPEKEKTSEVIEPKKPEEKPVRPPETEEEAPPGCPYHFGYLGRRPKDAAIPEECLTCPKMIKCMLKL